jgi:hypothetical protein
MSDESQFTVDLMNWQGGKLKNLFERYRGFRLTILYTLHIKTQ